MEAAYFRWLEPNSAEVTIADRAGQIVHSHLELGAVRRRGTAATRVYRSLENGSLGPAIQIVNDDMPHLVESVISALRQLDVTETEIMHPVFDVTRDREGRLLAIAPHRREGEISSGLEEHLHESWIHIQLSPSIAEETLDLIEQGLPRVLDELRRVSDDTPAMVHLMTAVADQLDAAGKQGADTDASEHAALLRWLADGNFTVLGYCHYRFLRSGPMAVRQAQHVAGSGLGVLWNPSGPAADLGVLRLAGPALRIANGSVQSALPSAQDVYIVGIAEYGKAEPDKPTVYGNPFVPVMGEHVFVGTLTVTGLHENVLDIPVISRRVRQVANWAGYELNSFSGRALLELMQAFPRAELFVAEAQPLFETVSAIMDLGVRRQVSLFLRHDTRNDAVYCLVYLPRDRYSSEVRRHMQELLRAEFDGSRVVYSARVTESDLAVVYFTVHRAAGAAAADVSEGNRGRVQELVFAATRTWADRLLVAAASAPDIASDIAQDYAAAFPEAYRHAHEPDQALADLRRLERIDEIDTQLYRGPDAAPGEWRFALYVTGAGISLSRILPVLHSLGVEVGDEQPHRLKLRKGPRWIYDFGLIMPAAIQDDMPRRFSDAVAAMWSGRTEVDGLNELVLAGLGWRQITILRGYAKYLQQAGFAYSFDKITRVLVTNPDIARLFVELFAVRFDPDGVDVDADRIAQRLRIEIDAVVSLDTDRTLRALLGLLTATLRTNYYCCDDAGQPPDYLSVKLNPRTIAELPEPRPHFEIFVYSPRVEGVHLRFGAVARGGLRWSDRLEDFRTEILGLVKAQTVKNAVIVPVGAKGGFVIKQPPAPTGDTDSDRAALRAEGIACYRTFVSGLLDITDNMAGATGEVVAPPRVMRRDGDDPYLVVAADKGTATFSDIANDIAREYGFWLGDAFASGGSAGYDHKAMGITAKGAWESVKRHFAELDIDTQNDDFTVVGIGDMSGDVFGNGMLLSQHIRLVAAFDHRHIFLDPDPVAAQSFLERRRMFSLPQSSWADYDTSLISAGGGVYDRSAKSIPVTPEVRSALALGSAVTRLSPPEMIKAILLAPVDLLWNGGIGTYVKSAAETHTSVGDKSNDSVRVDANRLRVKVIGEGGNLGITPLGRIEFCTGGGKCNTDALDNSAGVDCSDHEVNIKILLDTAVSNGDLAVEERTALLGEMTNEVLELVLRDSISQNVLMGLARADAESMAVVHRRLIADLESRRSLDRWLAALPSDAELESRIAEGRGLTSPELANLMAHVKLSLKSELLTGDLFDRPAFASKVSDYFPTPLRKRFGAAIDRHSLRREIVATMVVNEMVDNGGITYAFRLAEEAGVGADDAVRAFAAAVEIFDLHSLWRRVRMAQLPTSARDELELEIKRTLDRVSRWLLTNRPQPIDVDAEIARYRRGVARLSTIVPAWRAPIANDMIRRSQHAIDGGAPRELAEEVFLLIYKFPLLDVLDISERADRDPAEVLALYYALDEHFGIQRLLNAVAHLDRGDRWRALARLAIRHDLYGSLRALTLDVLAVADSSDSAAEKIAYWESTNRSRLARARAALHEMLEANTHNLATLSVAARQVRGMVSGGAAAAVPVATAHIG
ncbi:NAD-glutamate dehydrogenase [Nocardia sp. NPDC057030]|uniref:NAD-glutamate dehydrogenase n=1 Tax=Nocardia sp. NPDC057030 TaxID=3346005 RepID=UPI00362FE1A8